MYFFKTHFDFDVPFVGYEVRFFVKLGSMILNVRRSVQTSNCSIRSIDPITFTRDLVEHG